MYLDIIASTIDCEALVWGLGLIVLIFCNIILLLSFCVLYQKMKEIESKSNSTQHLIYRFYLYKIPGQDCNAVCFLPVT